MTALDEVLEEFHTDLERAEHLLGLIKAFRAFAAANPPDEIASGAVHWPEAVELRASAAALRTDLPVLSGSLLLYICGRFEFFIREVVTSLADDLTGRAATFNDLPARVQEELRARTLDVAQSPAKYGYTKDAADQLLFDLTKILVEPTSPMVGLSSRVLSITESNMHSRAVADVLKRVNISDLWNELGKQAPLKVLFSDGAERQCTVAVTSRLDLIMQERNGVAHPTASTTFPDPDQVLDSVEFFRVLSRVMVDVVKVPR